MKRKTKVYLILILVTVIIILSVLIYSYYTYDQITFYIIFALLVFGPIIMYAMFLDAKSRRTHWVDEYTRDRGYWEERGRIDARREEEAYNRRRREELREERAEERWKR